MEINDLIQRFSDTTENQEKAIFNSLFILENQLQTLFDQRIPDLSLKQFMLLSIIRQSQEALTFTELGQLMGCSRQNIKKIASVLAKKGYVSIQKSPHDSRALCLSPTKQANTFFTHEFVPYQKELLYLFEIYTAEEITTFFHLLTKLYDGIDHLEKRIADEK